MANHFLEWIKHPVLTSTIVPDSKKLSRLIIKMADISDADAVVELGPGSGGFTELILKIIPKKTKFFALEINPLFAKHTKKRCPGALVYEDNALNLKSYLKEHRLKHCDCIISGLPFTILSYELQEQLLKTIREALSPGGRFLTYTYVHRMNSKGNKRLRQLFEKHFDKLETSPIVWKNVPPAYVYCARKK